jgi:hypothetical protein
MIRLLSHRKPKARERAQIRGFERFDDGADLEELDLAICSQIDQDRHTTARNREKGR